MGERSACQRGVIQHRVRSKLLRHDGQFRMQNLPEFPSSQESIPFNRSPTASQHDVMFQLAIVLDGLRRLDGGEILQSGDWLGKLRRQNLGSWKTIGASTRECANNATSYTNWCLLAVNPRRSSHRSATPSSSRLVRRPDSSSVRAGSPGSSIPWRRGQACSGENGGARDAVEQTVSVEATSFFRPLGLECKCHGKRPRSLMGCIFCCFRVDWLSLEVLTYSRCSRRHSSSGERSSARRSLPARFSGDRTTRACARACVRLTRSQAAVCLKAAQ